MTDSQKQRLISQINSININQVLKYFLSGEVSLSDVPNIAPERKRIIEDALANMPNPVEQQEWNAIVALNSTEPSQALLGKLTSYINKWEGKRPQGNHVDDAIAMHNQIEDALRAATAQQEDSDWQAVDPFNVESLMGHLQKYPHTTHKQEIEDNVWEATDKEDVVAINQFISLFPASSHVVEARRMLNAIVEWDAVKQSGDVFAVDEYLKNNPNSPFQQQALIMRMQFKQQEIQQMQNTANRYEKNRLLKLLEKGIITENDLYQKGVLTEKVLSTLKSIREVEETLPDMNKVIADSKPECKPGFTDVFLLGIPSTGKTCALMGLSTSPSLTINYAHGGGDYASALQQYTDVGVTVPPTPGDFVTTLEAEITNQNFNNTVHHINLVEMAGESFAFNIANNEDKIYSFEDMGEGATKLLMNDNRKVFFLVIDPTSERVRIQRRKKAIDEYTGETVVKLEVATAYQKSVMQKMVSIFNHPDNVEIMKKVDAIHVIMTKSDTLGDSVEREDKAYDIFMQKYSGILDPLKKLCKKYNINKPFNYSPLLYTFSLGEFYVGGLYEYNPTDSDRLIKAICNSTSSYKEDTFWDKLTDVLNKPVFKI